ncbi:MAG: o-succinylbenzoate synthase [Chlamydiae bacterium]|nr:o-succinylbenzoate synthase [Chlamydiota bacterium]
MIEKVSLFSFEVSLHGGLPKRKGLLIELQDTSGKSSWGEVSPLPGFSLETLEEAFAQIAKELPKLTKENPLESLQKLLKNRILYPSVSIGLFGALYGLIRKDKVIELPLQGLLYGNYEQIQQQIPKAVSQGFSHIKLKTSLLSFTESKEIVDSLQGCSLRLDVNRSWSQPEADLFFSQFPIERFDYVEEPYPKNCALHNFSHTLALDESLRELSLTEIKKLPSLKALVIKPMLMGVGPVVEDLLAAASKHEWKISLSSSFETGVGLYQIALFAEYFTLPNRPMGLDTYKFLSPDILLDRHTICDGNILFCAPCPDYTLLSEVIYA